ncbi:MAG: LPS export ABC transporter permease LptG [Acidiferrobacterales bacterium]|nr:LPS export ABC transporter permease LptG [Acidiferrobacterales bacterium]
MRKIWIIDLYFGREITTKSIVAGVWLVAIYLFITLLDMLEDVSIKEDIRYVGEVLLLSVPRILYELAPMILLIGAILALTTLSRRLELTALQAVGVSKFRISASTAGYSILLALVMFFWGELVVPRSEVSLYLKQDERVSQQGAEAPKHGIWYRDGNQFIHITPKLSDDTLKDIEIFHFDPNGRLVKLTNAAGGIFSKEKKNLKLYGVIESTLENRRIVRLTAESKDHPIEAELSVIGAHRRDPSQLTIIELYRAIRFLRTNGLKTEFLSLAFWNRIISPLSMIVMMLFALLCVYRFRPKMSNGHLVFIGLLFGLLYFSIQQSVGYIAMLNGLQPVIGTFSTFLLFSASAIAVLARTE